MAQGATSLQTGGDVPRPLHRFAGEILWVGGRRRGQLGVFLPWLPVSGDYSGLQAHRWWGLRDFFDFQALGLGARTNNINTKTNAHKAKRLPRQASNHSVRVRAANNHGGRGSTESSQTGAHQKMTAPNYLIRALFLLQTSVLLD